ncbi:MAG: hypothetical protein M3008_00490 [Chloroflexota bacterium]|nr:hypothetical protein [Chloroflexota bacterium]
MGLFARIRRSLLALTLLTLLLCALVPATVAADSSTFQDPNGSYSFTLPDGWQALSPDSRGAAFTDTVNGTVFVLTSVPTGGVLSLNDANQAFNSSFPNEPGYMADPGGVRDLTVGNQPAKGFSYHSNNTDGSPLSTAAVTVINNGTAYLLLFLTTPDKEDASSPGVGTILTTWQFTS